jgi:hypothetical protein
METETNTTLTAAQFSVYKCISYFDVFDYPVRRNEVHGSLSIKIDEKEIPGLLDQLVESGLVSVTGDYYFLGKDGRQKIKNRLDNEARFRKNKKLIAFIGRFIARFPFVRSVSVSGSCSKGLLEEKGDLDFFVITAPGKLWICRTLLIAFKKIFLLNSKKYFCVNYFIDERSLEIPDQNLFVANEIKTLVPVSNAALHGSFLKANNWIEKYFPNNTPHEKNLSGAKPQKKYAAWVVEKLLDTTAGEQLDNYFFRLTLKVWKKKFKNFSDDDFDLNLRSRKNVSKHHPRGFQKKVLTALDERLVNVQVTSNL